MTTIDSFYRDECEMIDAKDVNAYFELSLSETYPPELILENSWGTYPVDLMPAIRYGETKTKLLIDGDYLRYDGEDGDSDCIGGDDLSRIISLSLLKDVDQTTPFVEGDALVMGSDGLFHRYSLSDLEARVAALESQINQ